MTINPTSKSLQKAKQKMKINKKVTLLVIFLFFFQFNLSSIFLILPGKAQATVIQGMCSADVDIVMIMDRSNSMNDGGALGLCTWKAYEGGKCNKYSALGESEDWCMSHTEGANPPCNYTPVFIPAVKNKLKNAQEAANSFLALLGTNDQSALVSFASDATLDKSLSNLHAVTQDKVNALFTDGSTNIGQAISLANTELGFGNSKATKAMILLTDGKANKPLGTGDGEDPRDVAYAEDMAAVAAGMGYKIFTIGLGSDVNATMLQNIATVTGAEYFFAPSGADLASIYAAISQSVCAYGSISGCKYLDANGDGNIATDAAIPGWTIYLKELNGPLSLSRDTNASGCYSFSGLELGDYTISEATSTGYMQTYPVLEKSYSISIDPNNSVKKDIANIDFGNYSIVCGNGTVDTGETCDDGNNINKDGCDFSCQIEKDNKLYSVTGYKYQDFDNNVASTSDWVGIGDWTIEIFDISASSTAHATTSVNGYFEFNNLQNGAYALIEAMKSGWTQLLAPANNIIIAGTSSTNNIFVNYYGICGNNIIDPNETCDDGNLVSGDGCSALCNSESHNGVRCGDGIKNQSNEECDGADGLTSGYSCLSSCLLQKESNGGSGGGGGGGGISYYPAPQYPAVAEAVENQVNKAAEVKVLGETGAPQLVISKSVSKEFANAGDENILYTIKVVNNGKLSAYNTVLKDKLPTGLVYQDNDKTEREWQIGELKTGEVKEFKYNVKISKTAEAKKYENIATIKADNHAEVSARATIEVRTIAVLAETGFANSEFAILLLLAAFFALFAFRLRQER